MRRASKIFKIRIEDETLAVGIDASFVAENMYNGERCNPLNGAHYHARHELFFAEGEPIVLYQGGETTEYSRCVLCIPPFLEHHTERKSGYRLTLLYKPTDDKKPKGLLRQLLFAKQPIHFPCTETVMHYLKEVERHFFHPHLHSDEMTEHLLSLLFLELSLACGALAPASDAKGEESYLDMIENALFDFQSDQNLGTVARRLGLSTKQVSRILRKSYDASFAELLCERRLSVAAALLRNTQMTVAEIVEYVNFPSESHFYALFKGAYGVTPSTYRKKGEKN